MSSTQVHPLPERFMEICPRCRCPVWVFRTPEGRTIAFDGSRGPYLTDADGTAWRSHDDDIGYRDHALSCERVASASPLTGVVTEDEFLWP